jgi:phage terminase large subunit-like protein
MSTATARRPPRGVESYATDPMAFSDDLIMVNERGQPFRLLDHQREILRLAFAFDAEGRLPWDTLLWSSVKKDGKTTINALLLLWWAYTQEAPNEAYVLANDQEQSMARAFATAAKLIRNNPGLATSAKSIDARRIVLTNGTTITALASDYAGAAGSDHGITSWDELWAYSSEGSRRLWEELTPVPTRVNSIRIITTYAGWEGESTLLRELYLTGVGPEEHPDGRGERIHPTLPLYRNRETRLLCYWDHEARAPWQSAGYRESQRKTLRPGTFLRLHENRWVSAESSFIDGSLWDSCVEPEHAPLLFADPTLRVQVGVDAALKHDCAAVVAVTRADDALFVVRQRSGSPRRPSPWISS